MRVRPYQIVLLFLCLSIVGPLQAAPVTAPYSIDFSQYPSGTSAIPNLSTFGTWNVTSDGRYSTVPFDPATAFLQVTNLADKDFEISTHFSFSGTGGVRLDGGGYILRYDGSLTLLGADTQPTKFASGNQLILRAHPHDGIVDLTGLLIDGPNTYSVSAVDTTPNASQTFGIEAYRFNLQNPASASFADITIIPEPSALLLVVLALTSLRPRSRS